VGVNLNATAAAQTAAFTLDGNADGVPEDALNYNSSTTVTMYDSQGGAHQVTLYYAKTADNAWDVHYVYEDPATPGTLIEATNSPSTLVFDTAGSLDTAASTFTDPSSPSAAGWWVPSPSPSTTRGRCSTRPNSRS
jgi:flagellar hook protein FlgE